MTFIAGTTTSAHARPVHAMNVSSWPQLLCRNILRIDLAAGREKHYPTTTLRVSLPVSPVRRLLLAVADFPFLKGFVYRPRRVLGWSVNHINLERLIAYVKNVMPKTLGEKNRPVVTDFFVKGHLIL